MAKFGDGWLSREISGQIGSAPLAKQLPSIESRHLAKIENGRHTQRSEQHPPARKINEQAKKEEDRLQAGLLPSFVIFLAFNLSFKV